LLPSTPPPDTYTLSLHDALPISLPPGALSPRNGAAQRQVRARLGAGGATRHFPRTADPTRAETPLPGFEPRGAPRRVRGGGHRGRGGTAGSSGRPVGRARGQGGERTS